RRKTGSHYTPRSLTAPIVREALEPILAQLGDDATPDQVLDLKICDPAMGSGAFLVETCRALGERLESAWARHPALLPDEARADPQVFARREVAKCCLYGVDKNHMATDLAKLSLWLVTLSKDEDFSFLDHSLKTGDSLVGLTLNQINAVSWETGQTTPLFASRFVRLVNEARIDRRHIRTAPNNVAFEAQQQRLNEANAELAEVRLGGDAVIAAFFSQAKAKQRHEALDELQVQLGRDGGWDVARQIRAQLTSGAHPITPFHWQTEFPEVFEGDNPGFDSIVGNPPFAGKNTITSGNRAGFLDWLKVISPHSHGNADLSAHFFRRAYGLLRNGGTMGLIATNTIGQGDTRESGLRWLLAEAGGAIYRARRRVKWAGDAAVVVSTVHMLKNADLGDLPVRLDGRAVSRISAFVREGDFDDTPAVLEENEGIAFIGSYILGMGFSFDDANAAKGKATSIAEMQRLIAKDARNAERIKPYLGGSEVNTDPAHKHHRYVIDFEDFPLRRDTDLSPWAEAREKARSEMLRTGIVPADYTNPVAADWPDLLEIVERMVKPERDKIKDVIGKRIWWRFLRARPEMHEASKTLDAVTVRSLTSSHFPCFTQKETGYVFDQTLIVWTSEDLGLLGQLSSASHEIWANSFGATLEDRSRYNVNDCFQTFPFLDGHKQSFMQTAETYYATREQILTTTNLGLTKTYNRFHNPLDCKDDIMELRRLHAAMDDAVLRAYGWNDLADMAADSSAGGAAPRFLHQTDEPEFAYQSRYHWPAWFRDKVLARLLALNRQRAAAATNTADEKLKPKVLQVEEKGTLI
ncbi:MAG: N-6 DNA methylase, partial [Alphaproteobacteria bacterium]|nr:N-6 DNA methylase [Alphaproteobacteria bacterium]